MSLIKVLRGLFAGATAIAATAHAGPTIERTLFGSRCRTTGSPI
jgi:hypothetical protein